MHAWRWSRRATIAVQTADRKAAEREIVAARAERKRMETLVRQRDAHAVPGR